MANEKLIQVVDLCKSYHKLDVIKHISVDFSKNEVVSIIGPSGGGKVFKGVVDSEGKRPTSEGFFTAPAERVSGPEDSHFGPVVEIHKKK